MREGGTACRCEREEMKTDCTAQSTVQIRVNFYLCKKQRDNILRGWGLGEGGFFLCKMEIIHGRGWGDHATGISAPSLKLEWPPWVQTSSATDRLSLGSRPNSQKARLGDWCMHREREREYRRRRTVNFETEWATEAWRRGWWCQ